MLYVVCLTLLALIAPLVFGIGMGAFVALVLLGLPALLWWIGKRETARMPT